MELDNSAAVTQVACTGGWRLIFSPHQRSTFIKAEDMCYGYVCMCLIINTHPIS